MGAYVLGVSGASGAPLTLRVLEARQRALHVLKRKGYAI